MNTKKILILLLCACFIGAQAFVVIVPYSIIWGDNWEKGDKPFWPFLRYPMYSHGKEPGDKTDIEKINIVLANGKKILVNYEDFHIYPYRLNVLIYSAKKIEDSVYTPRPEDYKNLKHLNYLIEKYIPNASYIELWSKDYIVTKDGIEPLHRKWEMTNSWKIKNNP